MAVTLTIYLFKKMYNKIMQTEEEELNEVIFFCDSLQMNCPKHKETGGIDTGDCTNKSCYYHNVDKVLSCLNKATSTLDVCLYRLSFDKLTKAIVKAHKRGVKVRVITDHASMFTGGSKFIDLLRQGITLRSHPSDNMMHHKFCIVDYKEESGIAKGLFINGSMNWTFSSVTGNWENVIISSNSLFLKSYQKEFDRLWNAFEPSNVEKNMLVVQENKKQERRNRNAYKVNKFRVT